MTSEELNLFIAKVRERDMVTPHGGEETSLFHLEQRANQERDRRERLKQPESSDAADSTLKNADNR
jgi:hypothetical protein